jgi:hypothetical protein
MKGEVLIDMKGEISSTLPHSTEQTNELGILISNILQDINAYMRTSGGSTGELRKTVLHLNNHVVRIVIGTDKIKAIVKEINTTTGGAAATTSGTNGAQTQGGAPGEQAI